MKIKGESIRYWSRDEIENIVKEKQIDRTHFYEYSKNDYENIIRRFYYSFCDYEKYSKVTLEYAWLKFRENLISSTPISANIGWKEMLESIKHEMHYDWNKKLYLILSDGWVYKGYIDEIISVLEDVTGAVDDFYIVSLNYECMAAYSDDGDCMVFFNKCLT